MYSRLAQDNAEPLTFDVSGKLWHGVLVFSDRQTGSLWTQLDGRALLGERAGETLEHVESAWTTWSAWKAEHPDTLVLRKDPPPADTGEDGDADADGKLSSETPQGSAYADYFADPEALFMPELGDGLQVLGPKDLVLGLRGGGDTLAVEQALVEEHGLLNVLLGSEPVLLLRDEATGVTRAFRARLDGQPVFVDRRHASGKLHDAWSDTDFSIDSLVPRRVDSVFWYAWKGIHPGSRLLAR